MAAPVPGGKTWSASNATSGSTYETTGPMVTELPTGKFGDITKFGGQMSTAMLTTEDLRELFPKIAAILKQAEEGEGGGGGGNPEMEAMKMEHAEEDHEQSMRHKEELHQLKVQLQSIALQQKQEAMAMKQQEGMMEPMPPEAPPPDPQQSQMMIDSAYENMQAKEPQVGPLKEGAYTRGYQTVLKQLGVLS